MIQLILFIVCCSASGYGRGGGAISSPGFRPLKGAIPFCASLENGIQAVFIRRSVKDDPMAAHIYLARKRNLDCS